MGNNSHRILFDLLKHKYGVQENTSYFEAIETMKNNGITEEELDALYETYQFELYPKSC